MKDGSDKQTNRFKRHGLRSDTAAQCKSYDKIMGAP